MYKLMIVDDELLMRVGIRSMIDWEEHGFQVAGEAGNGKEALEMALAVLPDLIITDIKMPVMDGLQLIRELSISLKACKCVILSNFDEFIYVKEALKLGAADYLIKSEITPAVLSDLLAVVREKLQAEQETQENNRNLPYNFSRGLGHLKEDFFKDLISGFISEQSARTRAGELGIKVRPSELAVLILKVNHFDRVKKKYVEKDEKLLRFSVLNIVEEVIPARWEREVITGNSSEYLVFVNTLPGSSTVYSDIGKLCSKIIVSIKDFMNLELTAGVSTAVPGLGSVKAAYEEAERALAYRFFDSTSNVLFYADVKGLPPREPVAAFISSDEEHDFTAVWESRDEPKAAALLNGIRDRLDASQADESSIRETYILLMEKMHTHFQLAAKWLRSSLAEKSPYEAILRGENWGDIHQSVLDYMGYCFEADSSMMRERTYTEMAVDIINQYYAEDISLQSVAGQINVNPSYLSRIFKQERGENFISYLTRVRIERAKVYLKGGKLKVYEIADKVGYHNHTYFSKIFKKIAGVSPEDYRE
ncbi:helix-turn-helix domain-containing protein [Paenibacillus sp. MMS20-IR301]|uniref:helix-turn-helix domain-containing protein n=1 Tax=Paenibacillus sp. MMS20-IR301 TaxID=2895946 RepID=UPI0028EC162D|nr:helix-turn-helix domain-containing protein [Paenibacillus sp. MMS20-IR301]WNS40747.1 response regulator [Paenibacillus sp. MMS20-IR301]